MSHTPRAVLAPGQDPEITYKQNLRLAKAVEQKVAEHYGATYSIQLEYLQRLEAAT